MRHLDLADWGTGERWRRLGTRRRWVAASVVAAAAVAVAIVVLVSLGSVGTIRSRFKTGRDRLERAQAALVAGDFAVAGRRFQEAATAFRRATAGPAGPLMRVEGWVPYIGRTPRTIRALAGIGAEIATAGTNVSGQLARLPGGLAALGPSGPSIPIATLRTLAPAVHLARLAIDDARRRADRLPTSWVLGPVASAGDLVRTKLAAIGPVARSADALVRSIPSFAGSAGPRRYFVAIENTAELRGTGGFIGNYAILSIARGRVPLSR